MSYLIPGWDLSTEKKQEFRQNTFRAGVQRAIYKGLAQNEHELVALGLLPSFLGLRKWIVPEQHPVGEWFTWIKHKTSPLVIAITHVSIVFPVTPGLNLLRFGIGETLIATKAVFSLSSLYSVGPLLKALEEDVSSSKIAEANNERERIEWLKNWPIMEGYFNEPLIYDPASLVNIQLFCDSVEKAGIILGGFAIEPIGVTVS